MARCQLPSWRPEPTEEMTVDSLRAARAPALTETLKAPPPTTPQEPRWRIDVEVVRQAAGSDPAAVVFDAVKAATARSADVLIIDTAGRLHTKSNLMEELGKLKRVDEFTASSIQSHVSNGVTSVIVQTKAPDVEFEKGRASVRITAVKRGNAWKVVSFYVKPL